MTRFVRREAALVVMAAAAQTGTLIYLLITIGVVGGFAGGLALYRQIKVSPVLTRILEEQERQKAIMRELVGDDAASASEDG